MPIEPIEPIILNHRYKLIGRLGSSSSGEAFLAEDTQMPSQKFFIKEFQPVPNAQGSQIVKEQFQKQAAAWQTFAKLETLGEHNQIPKLYTYFETPEKFYLVQEYIEGKTLKEKVQSEGQLSESDVRKILASLLRVLEDIHNQKIVHGDIKPDNIILRESDGKHVLIDFGEVKEAMSTLLNTQRNGVNRVGEFMAPEPQTGTPVYSRDLYSLGLTAIYLLTGKLPQELMDPNTGKIVWRDDELAVDIILADVLDKAVCSDACDRYSSAGEMLYALESIGNPIIPALSVLYRNSAERFAKFSEDLETKNKQFHWSSEPKPNYDNLNINIKCVSLAEQNQGYAIASVVYAVMSIEANLNEIFLGVTSTNTGDSFCGLDPEIVSKLANLWEMAIQYQKKAKHKNHVFEFINPSLNLLDKYQLVLIVSGREVFDPKSNNSYKNVQDLITLRNALVHYKPETWGDYIEPSKKSFSEKLEHSGLKSKIKPLNPFIEGVQNPFFPDRCFGSGCAHWAFDSSVKFIKEFSEKMGLKVPH